MVAIGDSLGDSIQRGRGRGGRGYLDKYITHKHQGNGLLFSHFGKPYSICMQRVVMIVVLTRYLNICRSFALQPIELCEMQQPWQLSSKLVIFKTKMSAATPKYLS